jgi:hypothetical protein
MAIQSKARTDHPQYPQHITSRRSHRYELGMSLPFDDETMRKMVASSRKLATEARKHGDDLFADTIEEINLKMELYLNKPIDGVYH